MERTEEYIGIICSHALIFVDFFVRSDYTIKERMEERTKECKEGKKMKNTESVDVEFKELDRKTGKLPESISKEVCAFVNTEGGELYVGVANDGSVVGVGNVDDTMTRLSNTLRDTILPDVTPFIQIRDEQEDGKPVVKLTASIGTERPYYLKQKGLTPNGVYVRIGSASVPVNEAGIRRMIMDTSGKSFEESRSLNQELTFDVLSDEMKKKNIEFGTAQMKTLKIIGADGLYTNLALLLSDQCPYTIKAAIFQGTDNAVFRERKEFSGSLLKQLREVFQFLDFYNKTQASFKGMDRTDQRDYPEDALREALLNSIIHRDYLFSGSTIINMYDDHIEFNSLGGLVSGLSMEAIMVGISQSRNPNLAAVFYRLKWVESYGTGIKKIKRLYANSGSEPIFIAVDGAFSVTMSNRNEGNISSEVVTISKADNKSFAKAKDLVYEYASENGSISRTEVEEITGFKRTKAYKLLKDMCDAGRLEQQSNGRLTVYLAK